MRLSLYSSFLLASLTTVFASEGAPSDVLDLNASNFESVVNPAELILVEFFAPWCGHCKALAPHYEEAATKLKEKNIPIAKVDCVDQPDLCQSHNVAGYPTLKVFRKGTPTDYNGPRKADGIVSYMVKQSLPAVTTLTADSHAEFIKADKVVVVLYATSTSEAPVPNFSKTAEKHRDDFLFGIATDPAVAQAADVSPPALVVYKSFDDGRSDFPAGQLSSLDEAKLGAWLKEHSTPLIDEVSGENYNTYAESGLPLAYIFVDPSAEGREAFVESFKPLAKEHKGKINFVWIDAIKFGEHAKLMNLQETNWPSFVVQEIDKQLKYPFDQRAATNPSSVAAFVKAYAAGSLEPSLRSAAIPEAQDEPVFVLVTKQFDEVVYDDKKDVFVEFYAPWCGHCKRLKPTWDSLGEKYADLKQKITIAKMDATENDVPPSAPFRVNGFPTIKFKAAGSRDFIDYEGDRSLESLIEFVEKHAKNDLTPPASAGTASSSSVIAEKTTDAHEHAHGHDHDEQAHIEL
ncbi:protein disulfide-isomerase precursor [Serendipita sp. 399]|nr:protein disulfide-isomerase precursor [Serendipita sp. 399]